MIFVRKTGKVVSSRSISSKTSSEMYLEFLICCYAWYNVYYTKYQKINKTLIEEFCFYLINGNRLISSDFFTRKSAAMTLQNPKTVIGRPFLA